MLIANWQQEQLFVILYYELVQWKRGFDETLSPWLDLPWLDPDIEKCLIAKFERYMINQYIYKKLGQISYRTLKL